MEVEISYFNLEIMNRYEPEVPFYYVFALDNRGAENRSNKAGHTPGFTSRLRSAIKICAVRNAN